MSLRVSVIWLGHDRRPAFVHMPGRILFQVGILRRHAVDGHDNFIAALCRAAAGANDHALRRGTGQTMTVLMPLSFSRFSRSGAEKLIRPALNDPFTLASVRMPGIDHIRRGRAYRSPTKL